MLCGVLIIQPQTKRIPLVVIPALVEATLQQQTTPIVAAKQTQPLIQQQIVLNNQRFQ